MAAACFAATTGEAQPRAPARPDLVLVGGKVFTADPARPWAEGLAITADRITAVGSAAEVRASAGSGTRVIELDGRVVVPGFNDAHTHIGPGAPGSHLSLPSPDPSLAEVLSSLKAAVEGEPAGRWIFGTIGIRVLDDPQAMRDALDGVSPRHPVFLTTFWGHGALLNTAALRALGIAEDEPDPPGGSYGRRPGSRRLNGIAHEYAVWRPGAALAAKATEAEGTAAVTRVVQDFLPLGITSVQSFSGLPAPRQARLFRDAGAPLRWRVIRWPMRPPSVEDTSEGSRGRDVDGGVVIWGRKWILDGTPIERFAAMRQPYLDRPGWAGRLNFSPAEIRAVVERARRDREPLLLHAVGDVALDAVLTAMEASGGPAVWMPLRVRIEHGDGLTPDLVARAAALGVAVVQNPTHLALRDIMTARIAPERLATFQPMRSLLAAGVPLALGSDGPPSPFLNIMLAVTHPVTPGEAITREQAVEAYTRGSAWAEFAEKDKGTLAPGMLADLAVLSQDIFTVEPDRLPQTASVLTVIGGRVVYDAGKTSMERSAP